MIRPGDSIIVPPHVRSPASLREYVGFEGLEAAHPRHELCIVWYVLKEQLQPDQQPSESHAVIFRMPRRVVEEKGWPFFIDQETRVMTVRWRPHAQ